MAAKLLPGNKNFQTGQGVGVGVAAEEPLRPRHLVFVQNRAGSWKRCHLDAQCCLEDGGAVSPSKHLKSTPAAVTHRAP